MILTVVYDKRDRFPDMRTERDGRRMVGEQQQAEMLAAALKLLHHGTEYVFVDIFYSLYFVCGIALVTAFVGCFDMDIHKIVRFQLFECRIGFPPVIRVKCTCRALNIRHVHTRAYADTLYQVNRADDRAGKPRTLGERRKRRFFSGRPEPERICLSESLCRAHEIERMLVE